MKTTVAPSSTTQAVSQHRSSNLAASNIRGLKPANSNQIAVAQLVTTGQQLKRTLRSGSHSKAVTQDTAQLQKYVFEGKSGSGGEAMVQNYYNRKVEAQYQTQRYDAEVVVLEKASKQIEDALAESFGRENVDDSKRHGYNAKLYVRVSKGPCCSCRNLFKGFSQDYPGVKIIIQYNQKTKQETDPVAKDRDLAVLKYGYDKATEHAEIGGFIQNMTPKPSIPAVNARAGGKMNQQMFDVQLSEYKKQKDKSLTPIQFLTENFRGCDDAGKALVAAWIRDTLNWELSADDLNELKAIGNQAQASDGHVVAKAHMIEI
jgi:hypothetical protein